MPEVPWTWKSLKQPSWKDSNDGVFWCVKKMYLHIYEMNQRKSIQYKAAFLLIVFSLNTLIGAACAVGLDMGLNRHHHQESAIDISESHHHHNSHHDETGDHHHTSGSDKDNCCNNGVMKFQHVDKNIATSFSSVSPPFFTSFVASFYYIDILASNNRLSDIKYFVRSYHPPIPDIRIAIQSFQI